MHLVPEDREVFERNDDQAGSGLPKPKVFHSRKEAEGQAEAIRLAALAQADAIQQIATQLSKDGGQEAAAMALAKEYVKMYGEMGSKSNTMFFQESAGNAQSLVVQAMAAMKAMKLDEGSGVKTPTST